MQAINESSARGSLRHLRRQSRNKIPHNPPISTADGSGTEVVSAPCSAARRLEPEAARQPRQIQILDALQFIGKKKLPKSIHLNKLIVCVFRTLSRQPSEHPGHPIVIHFLPLPRSNPKRNRTRTKKAVRDNFTLGRPLRINTGQTLRIWPRNQRRRFGPYSREVHGQDGR